MEDNIEELAVVAAVEGDFAWVETQRRSTCDGCQVNSGCGTAVLSKVLGTKRNRVRVRNTLNARLGNQVFVALNQNALSRGAQLVYGLPLVVMIIAAVFGAKLGQSMFPAIAEIFSIVFAIAGLVWALRAAKKYATKLGPGHFEPRMTRFVSTQSLSVNESTVTWNIP